MPECRVSIRAAVLSMGSGRPVCLLRRSGELSRGHADYHQRMGQCGSDPPFPQVRPRTQFAATQCLIYQALFDRLRGMQNDQTREFGIYLKSLRAAAKLSLRDAEGQSGVSNAFLSQIESGKVKKPSPAMLNRLAQLYRVPYATLMERAGHPVPKASGGAAPPGSSLGPISRQEERALLAYLSFLRSQEGRPGRRVYRSKKEKRI